MIKVPRIVIINGYPGAGKDTFVELCKEAYAHTYQTHTSNPAKEALTKLGWHGEKTPEARKLLADMMEFSYAHDGPFKYVAEVAAKLPEDAVLFVHCREFPNVLQYKRMFKNSLSLFIERVEVEGNQSNSSDANAGDFRDLYDYTIHNNGSLTSLKYYAMGFMVVATGRKQ